MTSLQVDILKNRICRGRRHLETPSGNVVDGKDREPRLTSKMDEALVALGLGETSLEEMYTAAEVLFKTIDKHRVHSLDVHQFRRELMKLNVPHALLQSMLVQ